MSVEYCEYCNKNIDTDFDVEHFDDEICVHQIEADRESGIDSLKSELESARRTARSYSSSTDGSHGYSLYLASQVERRLMKLKESL